MMSLSQTSKKHQSIYMDPSNVTIFHYFELKDTSFNQFIYQGLRPVHDVIFLSHVASTTLSSNIQDNTFCPATVTVLPDLQLTEIGK